MVAELKWSDEDMQRLAVEIFDELYFGNLNIVALGAPEINPCLQSLCHSGCDLLKAAPLREHVRAFIKHFNVVSHKYTAGQRGVEG
jgi:hypothetical protein